MALFTRTAKLDPGPTVRGAHELWPSIVQKLQYTHHQVSLTVSRNTTLVPSLALCIGPACEGGLSAGMQREHVPPQIKKDRKKERYKQTNNKRKWVRPLAKNSIVNHRKKYYSTIRKPPPGADPGICVRGGSPSVPLPFRLPSLPLPSFPLPSRSLPSLPSHPIPFPTPPLRSRSRFASRGPAEALKLPRGSGQSVTAKRFLVNCRLKIVLVLR